MSSEYVGLCGRRGGHTVKDDQVYFVANNAHAFSSVVSFFQGHTGFEAKVEFAFSIDAVLYMAMIKSEHWH